MSDGVRDGMCESLTLMGKSVLIIIVHIRCTVEKPEVFFSDISLFCTVFVCSPSVCAHMFCLLGIP